MKEFRIYFHYFLIYLKSRASYKLDFFAGLFSNLMTAGFGLVFILILIDGTVVRSLGSWSREEVLFIYAYSMLAFSVFNGIAVNLYSFGDRYVIGGQFDRVLIRPIGSIAQVIFESFNLDALGTFFLGCYLLNYSAGALGIEFSLLDYLWLFISVISGACILVSFFIMLASISFHVDDKLGVGAPVYSLITFGRYPVTIFNRVLQFILSCVVPFAFAAFYPATHFFKREGFELLCYGTPVVACTTVLVARYVWGIGVRKYASTGF